MDILKKIELYREEEEKLKWEGTFADYLEIVKRKTMGCSICTFTCI